jgi:8-oxo-dGTP pyrophosphatase MutT (NUDIX family)
MNQRPWQVLQRHTVHQSDWVSLHQDDVQLPDGSIIVGHHVVDYPRPAVGVVAVRADGAIMLVEHYRFIVDRTHWEVPAGRVDPDEDHATAAARELWEESGCVADHYTYLGEYHPANGSSNQTFHVYIGHDARQTGVISDTNEIMSARWVMPSEIWDFIGQNAIRDGLTLTAVLWTDAYQRGIIAPRITT